MPYNLSKTAPGTARIATNEAWEIKYWAGTLGCSEAEVAPVVKAMLNKPATGKNINGNEGNGKRNYR